MGGVDVVRYDARGHGRSPAGRLRPTTSGRCWLRTSWRLPTPRVSSRCWRGAPRWGARRCCTRPWRRPSGCRRSCWRSRPRRGRRGRRSGSSTRRAPGSSLRGGWTSTSRRAASCRPSRRGRGAPGGAVAARGGDGRGGAGDDPAGRGGVGPAASGRGGDLDVPDAGAGMGRRSGAPVGDGRVVARVDRRFDAVGGVVVRGGGRVAVPRLVLRVVALTHYGLSACPVRLSCSSTASPPPST